jgi:sister-chromatid-cohesion protein PDS5
MSRQTLNLFGANLGALLSKKNELVNHLNKLHKALREIDQDHASSYQKVLKNTTAPQLLAPQILSHHDKDIKVLVSCCIVDILRILAPENPYNNETTVIAFNAIIKQLHGLASFAPASEILNSHVYYIFNSLATVQSCVVPVLLASAGVFGAEDVAVSMFNTILSSVRSEHAEQGTIPNTALMLCYPLTISLLLLVLVHAVEILRVSILESEGQNQELLDQLLLPLLPQNKADNAAAYQVAATVLRNTIDALHGPLSALLNNILVGSCRESVDGASEIADGAYSLIFELHRIVPTLLNNVLPNLCMQLQVEEEEVRLRAVMLLGQLFASPHADYGAEFPRNLKDFLGRAGDISTNIRLEVVNACSLIVQYKPALKKHIEGKYA